MIAIGLLTAGLVPDSDEIQSSPEMSAHWVKLARGSTEANGRI
jgi:hypothetical protein